MSDPKDLLDLRTPLLVSAVKPVQRPGELFMERARLFEERREQLARLRVLRERAAARSRTKRDVN